ncbi:MAG: hypothetical protein IT424_10165 [Pirellulales bacterium]|nr:hypothetical protein [Pirellulales bacterium]
MSTDLNIPLTDATFAALCLGATLAGRSPHEEAAAALDRHYSGGPLPSAQQRSALRRRVHGHFGALDMGRPVGVDNDAIDADLAAEYGQNGRE